ncbi:MAG TPA: SRPBCC domain-containing protein [Mucilaginibacter sp.]|nr:SRPBCC domain-containing protein [Mucilaginibacter sp.]
MEQQVINCSITANISPEEAFDKISKVSQWWISNCEGRAEKPGDVFTVSLGTTWVTFKIAEVVPDSKVVWEITDCFLPWLNDKTEWTGSRITWDVTPVEGGVEISFTHDLGPEMECFDQCEKAWTAYIKESLFNFIKEGKGMPNKF